MTHRWTTRRRLVASLAIGGLLGAGACAQLGQVAGDITEAATGDKALAGSIRGAGTALGGLAPVSYDEEMAIGGALALQVTSRYGGEYKNKNIRTYVNTLGKALALNSDRPDIPYYFMVLNNPKPNAFATPGGYIFLTSGVIEACRTEAELAGVLGHEIAHVTERHTLEVYQRAKVAQGLGEVAASQAGLDPQAFGQMVDEVMKSLFENGLDQDKETDADAIGTRYAYLLGYDPRGLRTFLGTLGQMKSYQGSVLNKTHPSPSTRVRSLDRVLGQYKDRYGAPDVKWRLDREKRKAGLKTRTAGLPQHFCALHGGVHTHGDG